MKLHVFHVLKFAENKPYKKHNETRLDKLDHK